ncbi:MAG: O-Antigen ligase [Chloroflexota bacterium]
MGKASRRKRYAGGTVGGGSIALGSQRMARSYETTFLDRAFARWDIGLAVLAWCFWFLGHFEGAGADLAIPLWVLSGFAVGLLAPWTGLLLGIATIPFLGGAIDQPSGEVLRNLPIHAAAIRVLLDRFVLGPAVGRTIRTGPPTWVVVCAALAAFLYTVSVSTGALAVTGGRGSDPAFWDSGIRWVIGGSAGMMSAWIAGAHLVHGREKTFTNWVFVVLSVALVAALLAWANDAGILALEFIKQFTFPGIVNGRLAALGYPTPTSMGIAVSLPFALYGAWRLSGRLADRLRAREGGAGRVVAAVPYAIPIVLVGVAMLVIALTESRGPILALAAGLVAALVGGLRIPRRFLIPGAVVAAVMVLVFVQNRFETINPVAIFESLVTNNVSDFDRIMTWGAAVQIALGNPLFGGGWRAIERFSDFASRQVAYSHNTILHGFAEGGLPLGITNGAAVLFSVWMVWKRRSTMAPWLIAAAVIFFVCGFWDIPQVRTFASTMGGIAMGMAAGPLIARETRSAAPAAPGEEPAAA